MDKNKLIAIVIGGIVLSVVSFAGGWYAEGAYSPSSDPRAAFSKLTDAERQSMRNMSDEERTAFLTEKGIDVPAGGSIGGGPGGGTDSASCGGFGTGGTRMLEGAITAVSADAITVALDDGGSLKAIVDSSTVVASAAGASGKPAAGAMVIVLVEPEAAGVNAARAVVLR